MFILRVGRRSSDFYLGPDDFSFSGVVQKFGQPQTYFTAFNFYFFSAVHFLAKKKANSTIEQRV